MAAGITNAIKTSKLFLNKSFNLFEVKDGSQYLSLDSANIIYPV